MASKIEKFSQISLAMQKHADQRPSREAALLAVKAVTELSRDVGIPCSLKEIGIPESAIPEMAKSAMKVSRPIENNPRPMTVNIAEEIYRTAFEG